MRKIRVPVVNWKYLFFNIVLLWKQTKVHFTMRYHKLYPLRSKLNLNNNYLFTQKYSFCMSWMTLDLFIKISAISWIKNYSLDIKLLNVEEEYHKKLRPNNLLSTVYLFIWSKLEGVKYDQGEEIKNVNYPTSTRLFADR